MHLSDFFQEIYITCYKISRFRKEPNDFVDDFPVFTLYSDTVRVKRLFILQQKINTLFLTNLIITVLIITIFYKIICRQTNIQI